MYVCMYVCIHSQVAAKVEDEALWILATVEKHNEKKGIFVVVDDDAGEDKRRRVSPFSRARRIPCCATLIPRRLFPKTWAQF